MSDLAFFEDFAAGQAFAFGSHALSAGSIAGYRAAYDPAADKAAETTASPWQLCSLLMRMNYEGWMIRTAARGAPGVDEIRWHRPVAAGEVLGVRVRVLDTRLSNSRPELGFVRFEHVVEGAGGTPVLTQTNSVMMARRGPEAARPPRTTAAAPGPAHEPVGET
ncbi:hypothetical protein E4O86_15860, partial [Rhizobiales bacterium L72]|nr:hypothetical protein [Propylenella binzhouense]